MSLKNVSMSAAQRVLLRVCIPAMLLLTVPWWATGCNDYPLQLLEAKPYVEITDTLKQSDNKAVDILFVVDNSGSMKEEQEKLARNFGKFIDQLTSKDVGNYQIGIISTDMDDPLQRGKLQGTPRIINRGNMTATQVIEAFKKNIQLGIKGTSYEKALDAMRAALSPQLLGDANGNQGFLRAGALLAIIFIGDEDDCSHNGKIAETELDSEVCRIPQSKTLIDKDTGNPVLDAKGQPVKGHMEFLTPVSEYIKHIESLNRDVIVAGMIGNPVAYKDAQNKVIIDPPTGCRTDVECSSQANKHKCTYNTTSTQKCGGCLSKDADAVPGFRMYELIKRFGGSENWFPICGDDAGFQQALLRFAGLIIDKLKFVVLTKAPTNPDSMTVRIVYSDGRPPVTVPKAASNGKPCTTDTDCGGTLVCGADSTCHGDGWVYFNTGGQPKLALSGTSKNAATAGSSISVTYATK